MKADNWDQTSDDFEEQFGEGKKLYSIEVEYHPLLPEIQKIVDDNISWTEYDRKWTARIILFLKDDLKKILNEEIVE